MVGTDDASTCSAIDYLSSDRVTCFNSAHLISYSSDNPDLSSSELLRLAIGDEGQSVQPACINFSAFVDIFFSATFCALILCDAPVESESC